MRLGIIGDGRMGRAVRELAGQRGIDVVAMLGEHDNTDAAAIRAGALSAVDVAVEFTEPRSAVTNALACLESGVAVVIGTTGWYDRLPEVEAIAARADGALIWAPNFSVGVVLFTALVEHAGHLFADPGYADVHLIETHHSAKKDAPSGSALALANAFASGGRSPAITSVRTGHVPGTHEIVLDAAFEQVRLTHQARDRRVFADGALHAAAWLRGRTGVYTMRHVLGLEPERKP